MSPRFTVAGFADRQGELGLHLQIRNRLTGAPLDPDVRLSPRAAKVIREDR
mgnify:CR=1 FL=1